MKSIKLSIAVLVLSAPLGGCISMWNNDAHPQSESRFNGPETSRSKPDRTWRQDIGRDWSERDARLSRLRLGEFIDD